MKSFSRGIFFLFCATNSVQPFKSYDHSKIKRRKKFVSWKKAGGHHSKVPPDTLQIAEPAIGGDN